MRRLAAMLCGLWAALTLATADARAEKRVALVVGNGAYQNANPLPNPARDADAIAAMFRNAGFDVVETRRDLGNLEFKRVAREFSVAARDADIAVVYFAGHGIEVNGTNYLLPVDAKLVTDFDVEDEALSLDRVMRAVEPARRLRLIILDACRDNPFVNTMKRSVSTRNVSNGLARVEPVSTDTLVAFATRPGSTAEDGVGNNSPFAQALVKNLTVPGRDVRIALGHVRDDVIRATGSRQEPFVAGSLGGATVALVADSRKPDEPTRQISVLPNPQAAEFVPDPQRDYELAERVGTKEAWDSFLSVHPAGFYASLARAQRDKLVPAAAPAAQSQPGAAPVTQVPQQVAALPEPSDAAPDPQIDSRAIARELQSELGRVGCDAGAPDGIWGDRSREALDEFNRRAGTDFDTRGASVSALETVRVQRGRICPLICGS
ncbi:caspase family protein, partial [Pseudorhodoplanes sp.]|uniref:caspase family protein n=1 Tax=Pseudorhodoplanes sp. TaxID=1934341 RepID=UPI003D0B9D52